MLYILKKFIIIILIALSLAWILLSVILSFNQDHFIFPGTQIDRTTQNSVISPYSLYSTQTQTGNFIKFVATAPKPNQPVIVVFHGNGEIGADSEFDFLLFQKLGFGVVLAEYRGYGGNPESPSEAGIIADGLAQTEWAKKEWPDHPIVFWGSSLGTFVAASLENQIKPKAVILDSPFTSIKQAAERHFPILPVSLLIHSTFDSLTNFKKFTVPTLVIYGGQDNIVPPDMGRTVFETVRSQCPKGAQELYFENVYHKVLTNGPTQLVQQKALEFIQNALKDQKCF